MYASIDFVRRTIPATETHFQVAVNPSMVFLLHADGTDGSQLFPDATGRHPVTTHGSVQVDTAQFKFGNASALLNGSTDYLSLDSNGDFRFGTGDFTIDMQVRINAYGAAGARLYTAGNLVSPTNNPILQHDNAGILTYQFGGVTKITAAAPLNLAQWQHVAVARAGTNTKLFIDGTQAGSTYVGGEDLSVEGLIAPIIGTNAAASALFYNGWIDEIRILKGVAAWTSDFIPPASPYTVG